MQHGEQENEKRKRLEKTWLLTGFACFWLPGAMHSKNGTLDGHLAQGGCPKRPLQQFLFLFVALVNQSIQNSSTTVLQDRGCE